VRKKKNPNICTVLERLPAKNGQSKTLRSDFQKYRKTSDAVLPLSAKYETKGARKDSSFSTNQHYPAWSTVLLYCCIHNFYLQNLAVVSIILCRFLKKKIFLRK